jgi:crotonobetainyl-CoA:carnitine CoA-transferase CaiB-like acyl-CoA transferase
MTIAISPDILTAKLRRAMASPAKHDSFDIDAELADLLAETGCEASDSGGTVTFTGLDPIMPSTVRLGGAAALSLVQQSIVAARLHRLRGGAGQDIRVDLAQAIRRLAPATERKWELLNGYPAAIEDRGQWLMLGFYRTADDREVLAANLYPSLKSGMLKLLQCWDDKEAITAAIRKRHADELELAFEQAGLVMCKVRTLEEFMREPVYRYLASRPLIEIEKIGNSEPEPLPPAGAMPLSGVRALGMGHVIAGAGTGRSLASLGADVLNVWRSNETELEALYLSSNVGMRSCRLDVRADAGKAAFRHLASHTDIFFANRRPGLLQAIGADAHSMAALRPGIVHVTMSTHGEAGPWAARPGFDQVAGAVTGMLSMEGTSDQAALPPTVIVNDYLVGWLAATGAMAALHRRALEGGSYRVHVSLTRAALWIMSLGVFDKGYAMSVAGTAGSHALNAPSLFEADTPLGHYQGVSETVQMSLTPRGFSTVLVPRGASQPVWLPRGT